MIGNNHLLTVELDGTRYRGACRIEGQNLIVEAHGLGRKVIDASIVDCSWGEPAHRLARLTLAQFIKESIEESDDCGTESLALAIQGATTQICLIGQHAPA